MHVLCLQVAIVAGDYPLDLFHLLMCHSSGTVTGHFCCNGQLLRTKSILAVQPSFAAIQRVFFLVNSGLTYQQGQLRDGEASDYS